MEIKGFVASGLGEGALYVGKYNKYFLGKLGFEAFPGTLNLKCAADIGEIFKGSMVIRPEEKGLFPVHVRDAIINNKVKGAVVGPVKTVHKGILEVIAPLNIKEYLGLNEGDMVRVRLL